MPDLDRLIMICDTTTYAIDQPMRVLNLCDSSIYANETHLKSHILLYNINIMMWTKIPLIQPTSRRPRSRVHANLS